MVIPPIPEVIEFNVTGMNYSVGVVVPVYRALPHLRHCLAALKQQAVIRLEIVVSDGGSRDGTGEFTAEHHPDVRFISHDIGANTAAAVNRGIEALQGNHAFVAVVHPWVQARYDSLIRMIKTMEENAAGMTVPRVMDANRPDRVDSAGMRIGADLSPVAIGRKKELPPFYHRTCRVPMGCGNITLFRRDLLKQMGPFDEDLGRGWEFWEYALRAYRSGYRTYFEPMALAYRVPTFCRDLWSRQNVYHHCRGALPVMAKLLPLADLLWLLLLHPFRRLKVLTRYGGGFRLGSALKGELASISLAWRMRKKKKHLPPRNKNFRLLNLLYRE